MIKRNNTCLTDMLNNKLANCTKMKKANKSINIVNDATIIHNINNHTIKGVYLITFKNNVAIERKKYGNLTGKILSYLKAEKFELFFVREYIKTTNVDLRLENFDILTPIKQKIKMVVTYYTIVNKHNKLEM